METYPLIKFWPLMNSIIQEIWAIAEPHIEDAAVRQNIPIELYYYGELGLDTFSIEDFQQRDPFSNPEQFERLFPRLHMKGWIIPTRNDGQYEAAERAREGVRQIVRAGDEQLAKFESVSDLDLHRLLQFLRLIILANNAAPEPPQKWSVIKRFRVGNKNSPVIVQVRESLMDVFAYRDDAHLSAARPHFNRAGIVWNASSLVWSGEAVTVDKITEMLSFRGYERKDYAAALQAAVEVGWLEETDSVGTYRATPKGSALREQVEKLTDEYFYCPWVMFSQGDLDEFYGMLVKLREQLHQFKKVLTA